MSLKKINMICYNLKFINIYTNNFIQNQNFIIIYKLTKEKVRTDGHESSRLNASKYIECSKYS